MASLAILDGDTRTKLEVGHSRLGTDQSREYSAPLSNVVERYEDTEFGDLVLPRGEYGESSGIETGRGWEFIDATDDDVTLENIGRALEPDNAIGVTLPESDDSSRPLNVGVGIAGPVDDPELVFVVIVGDTILRATAQDLQGIDSQRELDAAREFLYDDASETTKRVITDGGLEDEDHPGALVETLGTFDDEEAWVALCKVSEDEDAPRSVREVARVALDDLG